MRRDTEVFPAYAGMILQVTQVEREAVGVPRIRGDDPLWHDGLKGNVWCSPHTRG